MHITVMVSKRRHGLLPIDPTIMPRLLVNNELKWFAFMALYDEPDEPPTNHELSDLVHIFSSGGRRREGEWLEHMQKQVVKYMKDNEIKANIIRHLRSEFY